MSSPIRTCVGCRTRRPASEMVRLARRPDGQVIAAHGPARNAPGRSVYVCPSQTCLRTASRRSGIARGLGRGGRVSVNPTNLWPAIASAVEDELDTLRRTTASTVASARLRALEELQGQLKGGA